MDKKKIIKATKDLKDFYQVSGDLSTTLDTVQCDQTMKLAEHSKDAKKLHDAVGSLFTNLRESGLTVGNDDNDPFGLKFYLERRGEVVDALCEILTKDKAK